MSGTLIVAEHDGRALAAATARCVSAARLIGAGPVDVLVAAEAASEVPAQAARLEGVDRVLHLELAPEHAALAAALAPEAAALAAGRSHVLGPSTTFGKDVMPRVAALLGVGQLSDVMAVEGPHRFRRPIYAGNAIVTAEANPERTLVATVRITSFEAVRERGEPAPVERLAARHEPPTHTRLVGLDADADAGGRPELTTAARVVAGGRGVGTPERFAQVERLADRLGAALGASRAAVDSGLAPNDLQVGQTGKIIAPGLYIAIGISGAIQHVTGIKDAGTIVAINKDPDAPIFSIADVGLVADLDDALPELLSALDAPAE